jgi:hypothetical protein
MILPPDQSVRFEAVDSVSFPAFLEKIGDRPGMRLAYHDEVPELMTPPLEHEDDKDIIRNLISALHPVCGAARSSSAMPMTPSWCSATKAMRAGSWMCCRNASGATDCDCTRARPVWCAATRPRGTSHMRRRASTCWASGFRGQHTQIPLRIRLRQKDTLARIARNEGKRKRRSSLPEPILSRLANHPRLLG